MNGVIIASAHEGRIWIEVRTASNAGLRGRETVFAPACSGRWIQGARARKCRRSHPAYRHSVLESNREPVAGAIRAFLKRTLTSPVKHWTDERAYFSLILAESEVPPCAPDYPSTARKPFELVE